MRPPRPLPALSVVVLGATLLSAMHTGEPEATLDRQLRQLDAIFAFGNRSDTPGCAVGVSRGPGTLAVRGYGMADLEHEVRNAPDTIFEAGSVSKQFTAAAVWLLAREGRLSLDDPVGRYLPELPDYGARLTIRHMLTHTSGLRDWGDIASIAGWPRTTRVYTHAHVLHIVARQGALNFPPGTEYSYSNTGYNLAAILVARVSGRSFPDFTRERIFVPLGMRQTSWRDDHGRIVRNRAIAYTMGNFGYETLMPFEDVHGNAGLLTTVGDLLTWNRNFVEQRVGGPALVHDLEQPARLNNGSEIAYGLGLRLGTYRGLREVSHGGATAGYRAYLARFPEDDLSVALLCNASDVDSAEVAHRVADVFLSHAPQPPPTRTLDTATNVRPAVGNDSCASPCDGTTAAAPTAPGRQAAVADLVGHYRSDEAEVEISIGDNSGVLSVYRAPDTVWPVKWTRPDAFTIPLGTVRILRGKDGRVTGLSLATSRVYDLRFDRVR